MAITWGQVGKNAWNLGKGFFSGPGHQAGINLVKDTFTTGIGRAFLLGFAAYNIHEQGLAKGLYETGKTFIIQDYLIGRAINWTGMAGSTLGAGAAGVALAAGIGLPAMAGVGIGQFWSRPLVKQHAIKNARLELGSPVIDNFGTLATMRQRSLMAMQNSNINGRSAMGQEATYTYRPYFR